MTPSGGRGDGAFPWQTLSIVWGDYARQKRGRQGHHSKLGTHKRVCRLSSTGNRFPGLHNLLNNLLQSAGIIKILPLFRKVRNRLKPTWKQRYTRTLVFKLLLYFSLGLLRYFIFFLLKILIYILI